MRTVLKHIVKILRNLLSQFLIKIPSSKIVTYFLNSGFNRRLKPEAQMIYLLILAQTLSNECTAQCENFSIFLELRFYVKSIFENLEVIKMPFFAILETEF